MESETARKHLLHIQENYLQTRITIHFFLSYKKQVSRRKCSAFYRISHTQQHKPFVFRDSQTKLSTPNVLWLKFKELFHSKICSGVDKADRNKLISTICSKQLFKFVAVVQEKGFSTRMNAHCKNDSEFDYFSLKTLFMQSMRVP